MKCHYEILGIQREAKDDEIKKAYRKLALKWHPDKNIDDPSAAKEQFQLIQQAYDVLSDPHERSWYDNHREAILKGGIGDDYKDDSIDLFQYFTSTCYRSYGDDEKGFYTIYRRVFETLAAEDSEFTKDGDSDDEPPSFGDSSSLYEDVHNFYAYWQSYATKRSFAWLDPYDLRDTPNRRVLRLVEKENKKVRDKAKRERNEQVRNLVSFVRKRDKRVRANAEKMAERARENALKAQEFKRQKLLERQAELRDLKVSDWTKFSNIEAELENIEAHLVEEFGEKPSEDDEDDVDSGALYCVACNKIFKTQKAFTNHENSKKHRDNIASLKSSMTVDDETESSDDDSETEAKVDVSSQGATGPEMPDFLLDPPKINLKESKETSDEELNSGTDEDSEESTKDNAQGHCRGSKVKGEFKGANDFKVTEDFDFNKDSKVTDKIKVEEDEATSLEELFSEEEEEEETMTRASRKKKKKGKTILKTNVTIESDEESFSIDIGLSKKQRRKRRNEEKILERKTEPEMAKDVEQEEPEKITEMAEETMIVEAEVASGKTKGKRAKELRKAQKLQDDTQGKSRAKRETKNTDIRESDHRCATCKIEFSSKNKLFDHLKKSGHSIYLPGNTKTKKNSDKKTRGRARSDSESS